MSKIKIKETRGHPVTAFDVRNGWEWGTILIRPLLGRAGAEVLCNSSFGVYGYCWTHMGEDWRSFLADLEFDYAMGKMLGDRFYVPLEKHEFIAKMREVLDDREAQYLESWGEVIPVHLVTDTEACREALKFIDEHHDGCPPDRLFGEFDELAGGIPYRLELYDYKLTKPCPQARAFWDKIWTPFAERLAADNVALLLRWKRELDLAEVSDLAIEVAA